ncbi:DUF952 domain-containing protein [Nocardioides cavernaquae]|uniref:DUF952 domain-containing protein n=1 Tax=Nocardioides cavernaquae TaxID=2321396 RepID=A0A3A5H952_9ACTN|nr:DUF952 domain-containing protein [Nocardioides cavernaquae]RJS46912.1 DUF952 domain-containing protein [Nocardioides cavernaquae]
MLIFHIAERSRWQAAKLAGSYAQSTLGQTLEEVGFLHASRADQWEDVRARYYADVRQPLVLLVIDTDLLTAPWSEDPVTADGVETTYPHIHGPLNPSAVVEERPLTSTAPPTQSFFRLFFGEVAYRMIAALVVMVVVVVVHSVLRHETTPAIALLGTVGAAVGIILAAVALKGSFLKS